MSKRQPWDSKARITSGTVRVIEIEAHEGTSLDAKEAVMYLRQLGFFTAKVVYK